MNEKEAMDWESPELVELRRKAEDRVCTWVGLALLWP
jgi:hypothetical protein